MDVKLRLTLILLFFSQLIYSQFNSDSTRYITSVNDFNIRFGNDGVVHHQYGIGGGAYDGDPVLFHSGIMLKGKSSEGNWANKTALDYFGSLSWNDYLPGRVNSTSDDRNKLYKVSSDSEPFGEEWLLWEEAVKLGADYYDGDGNGEYNPVDHNGNGEWDLNEDKPDILGDETVWCVYNDGKPSNERVYQDMFPLGIEVHQTVFGYNKLEELNSTIFIRYRLINTGTVRERLDSVYFAMFADADIQFFQDNLSGCDTLLSAAYTYNDTLSEGYTAAPPVFMTQYLQGPPSYIPNETFIDNNQNGIYDETIDTPLINAYNRKGFLGVDTIEGAKNREMSSFFNRSEGHPDGYWPDLLSSNDLWNALEHKFEYYDDSLGVFYSLLLPCWEIEEVSDFIDVTCEEVNPYYQYSGNPIEPTGWIQTFEMDDQLISSIGPFDLETDEPIDIVVAYIAGLGESALNSIDVTRGYAEIAKVFFNSNFITSVEENEPILVNNYLLEQNYPNPFNPTTAINYAIPKDGNVTLKIYDMLGAEVMTLVNANQTKGRYEVKFNASFFSSGVYIYRIQSGTFLDSKKMILMK